MLAEVESVHAPFYLSYNFLYLIDRSIHGFHSSDVAK